jgi:hypothetical protein
MVDPIFLRYKNIIPSYLMANNKGDEQYGTQKEKPILQIANISIWNAWPQPQTSRELQENHMADDVSQIWEMPFGSYIDIPWHR